MVFLLYEKTRRVEKRARKDCESGGFDAENGLISEKAMFKNKRIRLVESEKFKNSLPTEVSWKAIDYFFCFVPSGG